LREGGPVDSLAQLLKHLGRVGIPREPVHDLELGELDVDRVVVLAKEDLDLVLEDRRPALDDEQDVAQGDVLDLGPRRQ
jgi:hypothetical protein